MKKKTKASAPSLHDLFARVNAALERLPGVELLTVNLSGARCRISLTLDRWDSLLVLHYCAEAANVRFHSYSRHNPTSREARTNVPRALVHAYWLEYEKPKDLRNHLEALGACLTTQLFHAGHINAQSAKPLLTLFNGSPSLIARRSTQARSGTATALKRRRPA